MESRNRLLGTAFTLPVVVCISLFFIPAFIIRPFHHQTPEALTLAMVLRQQAPLWTLITAAVALLFSAKLWRRTKLLGKGIMVLSLLLVAFSAVMARVDYFEWMFHPVKSAGFDSVVNTRLDPSEMVMAVRFGNDSRAYPIRAMAYHHVFNDVVNGEPIVVTY